MNSASVLAAAFGLQPWARTVCAQSWRQAGDERGRVLCSPLSRPVHGVSRPCLQGLQEVPGAAPWPRGSYRVSTLRLFLLVLYPFRWSVLQGWLRYLCFSKDLFISCPFIGTRQMTARSSDRVYSREVTVWVRHPASVPDSGNSAVFFSPFLTGYGTAVLLCCRTNTSGFVDFFVVLFSFTSSLLLL